MDRRTFLESVSALTAGFLLKGEVLASGHARDRLGDLLPTRTLGRTDQAVTMLGVGGWHIGRMSEREAQRTIETALEGGVRFFDSAESYQSGGSERRLGKLLVPKYRDVAFLMTKSTARSASGMRRHLEGSLRRLNTDYLDLWQVHSIQDPGDVDNRISRGVLEEVQKAREEGKVRFIGFTGHADPAAHQHMLEETDIFETCQMPINVADVSYKSFIVNVLPKLVERKVGVIAMKTLANGGFFGGRRHGQHGDRPRLVPDIVTVEEAIRFVWSLPVSVIVSGPDDEAQMSEKIKIARSFKPLSADERADLVEKVAPRAGATVEFYKS